MGDGPHGQSDVRQQCFLEGAFWRGGTSIGRSESVTAFVRRWRDVRDNYSRVGPAVP